MKILNDYRFGQFEKAMRLSEMAPTLKDVHNLSLEVLYPEFGVTADDCVGYFNPFCSGKLEAGRLESVLDIGQGASILNLLPFHSKIIVHVDRIPEAKFQDYYGVDFRSFRKLIDAGRVLPILPTSTEPLSLIPGERLTYLEPLFLKGYPSGDRQFLALRQAAIKGIESDRSASVAKFTRMLTDAVVKLFGTSTYGGSFLVLGNRSIYRGQPILLFLWIHLASRTIKSLEPVAAAMTEAGADPERSRSGLEDITTFILDTRDRIFESTILVPGALVSYSRPVFEWLHHEISHLLRVVQENHQSFHESELEAMRRLSFLPGAMAIDELAVLKSKFIYEPIEAVGDIDKLIHWLEHSTNVSENRKLLAEFSRFLEEKNLTLGIQEKEKELRRVSDELNREVRKVAHDMKASRMVLEVGATIGTAVAGKYLGSALSAADFSSLFSMCGALAGAALGGKYSAEITERLGSLVHKRSLPFLLWRRQKGTES